MDEMTRSEAEALEIADKFTKSIVQKKKKEAEIINLEKRIVILKREINELDRVLKSLLTSQEQPASKSKNIIEIMVDVMSETVPMTTDEIINAVRKQKYNAKDNSIKAYLSNNKKLFENIKKNDERFEKRGWICHRDNLEK